MTPAFRVLSIPSVTQNRFVQWVDGVLQPRTCTEHNLPTSETQEKWSSSTCIELQSVLRLQSLEFQESMGL
jgi:hypothetical protein